MNFIENQEINKIDIKKLSTYEMLQKGNASLGQGRAEEAEYFYKNILISTPKHPDANHNLGLITLSKNETKKALSLFKNALDINPNVEQFWLSYIEALIKDHQIEKVEHLFNSNKKIAVSEDKILKLKSKLNYVKGNIINTPTKIQLENLLHYYQNVVLHLSAGYPIGYTTA